MTMAEILGCPFCGRAGTVENPEPGCYAIGCDDCCFSMMEGNVGIGWYATEAEAIAAWNRRIPPPQAAGGEPVAWVDPYELMMLREHGGVIVATGDAEPESKRTQGLYLHPPAVGELWVAPLTGKYGDVLRPFLKQMEAELHANVGKGDRPGWLAMSPETAMLEIYYHVAKLQKATKDNDGPHIIEYAADVANMAMMMLDICGGIGLIELMHRCDTESSHG